MNLDKIETDLKNISYKINAGYAIGENNIKQINKLKKPNDKEVYTWLSALANNQFTLDEIENGTAHKVLKKNYGI